MAKKKVTKAKTAKWTQAEYRRKFGIWSDGGESPKAKAARKAGR